MSNSDFEIEQVDTLGARASKDTGINAEFPQRVETSTDLNYYNTAKKVDTKIQFPQPSSTIYEVKRRFDADELALLISSNRYYGSVKKAIERNAKRRQNCARMLAVSFKENTRMTPKLSERLLGLQEIFEIVGIYDGYNYTASNLQDAIKTSYKIMDDVGMTPKRVNVRIPTMIQHPELLRDKMSVSFKETDGIAIKHAAISRAPRQYRQIRTFTEKGKWTHMYDTAGVWSGNDRTSLPHILQLYGIDSYGHMTRKKPPEGLPPITPKRLDIGSLAHLTIQEHTQRYGRELYCPCPLCAGKTMIDMENDYNPYERYPIFRSHLPYASNFEFAMDRHAILEKGKALLNRLQDKEFMAEPFKAIYGTAIDSPAYQPKL